MYCLQWLIPVLLIPKPVNPALLYNHAVLMVLYLTGFFLERKPCTICSVVFAVALALVWYVPIPIYSGTPALFSTWVALGIVNMPTNKYECRKICFKLN